MTGYVLLVGIGIYLSLAAVTCALVGARRSKLRRGVAPHPDWVQATGHPRDKPAGLDEQGLAPAWARPATIRRP